MKTRLFVSAVLFLLALPSPTFAQSKKTVEGWTTAMTEKLARGSKLATTSKGIIEYDKRGSGPVVICLHGGPGGYDQSSLIGEHLVARGFTVIGVSRPGYLRTPIEVGESSEEQADAMIALMDALGIQKAAALGFSAGSLVAFQMGAKYGPDNGGRIWACVLEGVGSQPGDFEDGFYDILGFFLTFDELLGPDVNLVPWMIYNATVLSLPGMAELMLSDDIGGVSDEVIEERVDYVMSHAKQRGFLRRFIFSILPLSLRNEGLLNDIKDPISIDPWQSWVDGGILQNVKVPMVIVQSVNDSNGNYQEAQTLMMPNIGSNPGGVPAQLISVEGAGHFVWLGVNTDAWQKQVSDFLKANKP